LKVVSIQYAALPWRKVGDALEILLVTTLNTKRWIVPKGWPVAGRQPCESAAHEALEEAGVLGEMGVKALGSFRYDKRRKSGEIVPCKVDVFAMEVVHQRRSWAEKGKRETCWCSIEEALARVSEPGLRRVIARFAKVPDRRPARRAQTHAAPQL
jgi:8-oxo-dGTP pyrophosphatase MutT (NUDIX family)